jgi:tetratricopeptide (TPR) repeat protein
MIYGLDSTDVTEKFSALLVMAKQITKDDLKSIVTQDLSMWELDQKIIESRSLNPEQIKKVFSLQLSRMVNGLLEWDTINYKISERSADWPSISKKPLCIEEMMLHLCRHIKVTEKERSFWNDLQDQKFLLNQSASEKLKTMPFNTQESYVISACNNELPPSEILRLGTIDEDSLFDILETFRKMSFILTKDEMMQASIAAEEIPDEGVSKNTPPATDEVRSADEEAEVLELIESNREFLHELEMKDYFELFEVSPDNFNTTDVKNTYHEFVRQYHPDKYRRLNSDELNEIMENILNTFNTAYETLIDKDRLDEYVKNVFSRSNSVSSSPGPSSSHMVAKENFMQGKSLINAKHYAEAIGYLKRAVRIKPDDGDYHAYLGYAMSKTVQYRREAEDHFLKAIELSPMNINAYLHLGRLYRDARMYLKAEKIFNEALQWDPENKIALKELEEIGQAKKSKSKGFLNKLFGK